MFTAEEFPTHLMLTFHAPDVANAFAVESARALTRVRRHFAGWQRPVVVRSGHPTVFCAGGDLKAHVKLTSRAAGLKANAEIARAMKHFAAWGAPKLAVVEGRAIGGGVEWLAFFDFRWATAAARLEFRQKHLGLSFGWGGLTGAGRVRQLLLGGEAHDAATAWRLGLVDRLVDQKDLQKNITAWAQSISSPIDQTLVGWTPRAEAALFRRLWWAEPHRAALRAWASKK